MPMLQRFAAITLCFLTLTTASAWARGVLPTCVDDSDCPEPAYTEQQPLIASGQSAHDLFGLAVHIDGDTIAVGAPWEGQATQRAGVVYLFERKEGVWAQTARLSAAKPSLRGLFGSSLSLRGNTLVVGAPGERKETLSNAGAVYVFQRNSAGEWAQTTRLQPEQQHAGDFFGASVAQTATDVIVGAHLQDDTQVDAGQVYVFRAGDKGWSAKGTLKAPGLKAGSLFGNALEADGNTLAIGAYGHENKTPGGGAVFLFEQKPDGEWHYYRTLNASKNKAFSEFGWSLDLRGNRLLVGAPYEDTSLEQTGSSYLFERDAKGEWVVVERLVYTEEGFKGRLGASVALLGEEALSGAPFGQTILFAKQSKAWAQQARFTPAEPQSENLFNHTLASDGNTVVIGIPESKGNASGQVVVYSKP
jgi:hypothetical protein